MKAEAYTALFGTRTAVGKGEYPRLVNFISGEDKSILLEIWRARRKQHYLRM